MPKVVNKPQAVAQLESEVVRLVRARDAISRTALARELKLVPSTAGIYVDRLLQRGFLKESAQTPQGLGRPPVLLELNPKGGRFIGVDFDARQVMAAVVDFAQQPLKRLRRVIPARASVERVLGVIEELIEEAIGARKSDVLGIGLGVPGPIDAERGISRRYQFIRDWRDVPIGPRIGERFHLPTFVENNLRSMALGELWCGQGRGVKHLICVGVRSGIGTGMVVDGKLLSGAHNLAGEIGHWKCPEPPLLGADSPKTRDASPRSIEDAASLTGILAAAAEQLSEGRKSMLGLPGDTPSAAALVAAAEAGDELAGELLEQAARTHGWIVHQLATLLDPELLVVAGPLAESDKYLQKVQQAAAELSAAPLETRIVRSTLGEFAGALGAAALAFHHWKPRR